MSKITLTGAKLQKMSVEDGSAGPFCLLKMRADYTATAQAAMDWPALPSGSNLMDLEEAEIPFGTIVLTSQQQNLDGSAPACLSLEMSGADTFRIVRVKGKKGAASFVQVRFNVKTTDSSAAQAGFEYKRAVRKSLAELVISWGAAVKQMPAVLKLTPPPDVDRPLSAKEGMDLGKGHRGQGRGAKGGQRAVIAAAAAAERPSVSIEPDDAEAVTKVIDKSLQ